MVVAAIVLSPSLATAQVPARARPSEPSTRTDRAAELFRQSAESYSAGRFAEAVALLREAYESKPEPVLLYNLARACEGMGDLACAIDAYARYVESEPNLPDRGAIDQRLVTLRRQLEAQHARREAPPTPPPAPAPAPAARSPVPWLVVGGGALGFAAGVTFGALATTLHHDASRESTQEAAARTQSRAETFATVANVSFAVGGALAAAGLVWAALDATSASAKRSSTSSLWVGATGAVVSGRF